MRGATSSVGLAAVTYAKASGLNVIATTRAQGNKTRLEGAATLRRLIKTLRPFGAVSMIGLLGDPHVLEQFQLCRTCPATRFNFFPRTRAACAIDGPYPARFQPEHLIADNDA